MTTVPFPAQTTDRSPVLQTVDALLPELLEFRRDLHAHPELSWQESRTSTRIRERLAAAGVPARSLEDVGLPTAVVADFGPASPRRRLLLRADIDALPVKERTGLDWASTVDGVCHACGHDVHAAALLGATLALYEHRAALDDSDTAVRVLFQPAEEVMPGGAIAVRDAGVLAGVDGAMALHVDPTVPVGAIGLREGPVTAAADKVTVRLTGRGGHSSRPHLTEDVTFALAKVLTEVPAVLSRRVDPRAVASVVWGRVRAGDAPNVIPAHGEVAGTLRILDTEVWDRLGEVFEQVVEQVAAPYAVRVKVDHVRGVPPVVNAPSAVAVVGRAAMAAGLEIEPTHQSLGGEDFGWLLREVPGALVRLGTQSPSGRVYDLHQGDLIVDEGAIGAGARLLACVPLA
ncbi:amidohydrolase [Kribbia dieselivorans]|uniref:amidohydrolase n=1 Tax=Kribbia dieselivorans TaxID=331526 RepID=UPI0009FAC61B|nr:amidohydrolase [Kribbia dieselivorans]